MAIELPLEPLVKAEFRGVFRRETASGSARRALVLGRPLSPIAAKPLGQRGVEGELHERLALAATVLLEVRIAGEICPQRGKRLPLQAKYGVAIDPPLGIDALPAAAKAASRDASRAAPGISSTQRYSGLRKRRLAG